MNRKLVVLFLACALPSSLACGEDLVTRDGTVYHDYKVLSHDAGFVTILDSDGGGKIPLSNLPDDLQKKYGYNKQAADAAVQAAIAQDRQDRQAIAKEESTHQQQMAAQAQTAAQAAPPTPLPEAAPTVFKPSPPTIPAPAMPVPGAVSAPAPPTNIQPGLAAATPAGVPPSPGEIDALKKKISDAKQDLVDIKIEDARLHGTNDAREQELSQASQKLAVLRGRLAQVEANEPKRVLSWAEVAALHDKIVDHEDDISRWTTDSLSDDVRTQITATAEIDDANDEIEDLRRHLQTFPKQPLKLSPEDVTKMKQEMVDLKNEIDEFTAKANETVGDSNAHPLNSDTEELALLKEKLAASGNP